MQCPPTIALFQAYAIGEHWNIVGNTCDTQTPIDKPAHASSAILNRPSRRVKTRT